MRSSLLDPPFFLAVEPIEVRLKLMTPRLVSLSRPEHHSITKRETQIVLCNRVLPPLSVECHLPSTCAPQSRTEFLRFCTFTSVIFQGPVDHFYEEKLDSHSYNRTTS